MPRSTRAKTRHDGRPWRSHGDPGGRGRAQATAGAGRALAGQHWPAPEGASGRPGGCVRWPAGACPHSRAHSNDVSPWKWAKRSDRRARVAGAVPAVAGHHSQENREHDARRSRFSARVVYSSLNMFRSRSRTHLPDLARQADRFVRLCGTRGPLAKCGCHKCVAPGQRRTVPPGRAMGGGRRRRARLLRNA